MYIVIDDVKGPIYLHTLYILLHTSYIDYNKYIEQ